MHWTLEVMITCSCSWNRCAVPSASYPPHVFLQDAVPPGPRHLLVIDSSGDVRILTRDKHELAEELEIPIRDMRVVDPLVSMLSVSACSSV